MGDVWRQLIVIVAALDANEDEYTAVNFATMTSALNQARDLVYDAVVANDAGDNPNP